MSSFRNKFPGEDEGDYQDAYKNWVKEGKYDEEDMEIKNEPLFKDHTSEQDAEGYLLETKIINDHSHQIIVDNEGVRITYWSGHAPFVTCAATPHAPGISREDAIWLRDALIRQFPLDLEKK